MSEKYPSGKIMRNSLTGHEILFRNPIIMLKLSIPRGVVFSCRWQLNWLY